MTRALFFAVAVLPTLSAAFVYAQEKEPKNRPELASAPNKKGGQVDDRRLRDSTTLDGLWYTVPKIQTVLNDMSQNPDYLGRLDAIELKLNDMNLYWIPPKLQKVEKAIKRLADDRGYSIVATGVFEIMSDRPPKYGHLMITHKDGERFLCVLDIENGTFTPWRLHFVGGKDLERDLLILEIEESKNRQIVAFQRFIPGASKKLPAER